MTELISLAIIKLFQAFPQSTINYNCEFIADIQANEWFRLEDCHNELDIKCKVLEWLSRGACKTRHYDSEWKTAQKQKEMRDKINKYLGTSFTADEMMDIYTYLGNCCHHDRTIQFIKSGYDMKVLNEEKYETIETRE